MILQASMKVRGYRREGLKDVSTRSSGFRAAGMRKVHRQTNGYWVLAPQASVAIGRKRFRKYTSTALVVGSMHKSSRSLPRNRFSRAAVSVSVLRRLQEAQLGGAQHAARRVEFSELHAEQEAE